MNEKRRDPDGRPRELDKTHRELDKTHRELDEQHVSELLKQNFRGLDPWIPERPPLGSVVPRYDEGTDVGTPIKLSFGGGRNRAPMNVRTPRPALALLAAAIVVAVGVTSLPFLFRGGTASSSNTPVPTIVPGSPVPSGPVPSALPSPAQARATDLGNGITQLYSADAMSSAFTSTGGTYVALAAQLATQWYLMVLDQQGRELNRWPWDGNAQVTWLDDTTFLAVSGTSKVEPETRQVLRGTVGDARLETVASLDNVACAIVGSGHVAIGQDVTPDDTLIGCDRYVIVDQGSGTRPGIPIAFSPDGSRLAVLTSLDPAEAKFLITDLTGREILRVTDLAYYQGSWPVFAFSPDGRYVAYPRYLGDGKAQHVAMSDLADGHLVMDAAVPRSERALTELMMGWTSNASLFVATSNYDPSVERFIGAFDLTGLSDDVVAPRAEFTASQNGLLATWSAGDSTMVVMSRQEPDQSISLPGDILSAYWSSDGTELYVLTAKTGSDARLLVIRRP